MASLLQTAAASRMTCFFHISNVELGREPRKGSRVSYFIAPAKRNPNRLSAHDVTVLE